MKKTFLITLSIAATCLAVWSQSSEEIAAFRQAISKNKDKAKTAIESYRYDGSKITYFNYKSFDQVKEVEVYMFNRSEYKFSINSESADQNLTIEVYDKSKSSNDRHLLKTIENAGDQQIDFNSLELNSAMKDAVPNAVRLKRVYLNYIIHEKDDSKKSSNPMDNRGAIILVMGYE